MKHRLGVAALALAIAAGAAAPIAAADKETRQLMADIRILEEQSQQSVALDDPGNWARQALTRVREWLGAGVAAAPANGQREILYQTSVDGNTAHFRHAFEKREDGTQIITDAETGQNCDQVHVRPELSKARRHPAGGLSVNFRVCPMFMKRTESSKAYSDGAYGNGPARRRF